MIKGHYSEFELAVIKIAKEQDISASRISEKIIEVLEPNNKKFFKFFDAVRKINSRVKVIDLIASKQYTSVKGQDIRGSKALYLTDDDYYNKIMRNMGNAKEVESTNMQMSLL